ncbi:hypothetical protein F7R13_14210 [Burkholderia territorii]|uniref:Uncharacterized protein n=1 Tax=Burkholderia territorii TaxID=1503055 RepID=A0A6L3NHN0_9BURK|nr:hypothetical protein F7R13_14210 [Burkholderia territorii]
MPARRYLGPSHLDVSVVASTWSLRKTPGNYCPSAIACGTRTLRRALRSDRSAWPSTRSYRAAYFLQHPCNASADHRAAARDRCVRAALHAIYV